MNNNKAAVIIDGPEDVLNSKDVNNPITVSYTHLTLPTKVTV